MVQINITKLSGSVLSYELDASGLPDVSLPSLMDDLGLPTSAPCDTSFSAAPRTCLVCGGIVSSAIMSTRYSTLSCLECESELERSRATTQAFNALMGVSFDYPYPLTKTEIKRFAVLLFENASSSAHFDVSTATALGDFIATTDYYEKALPSFIQSVASQYQLTIDSDGYFSYAGKSAYSKSDRRYLFESFKSFDALNNCGMPSGPFTKENLSYFLNGLPLISFARAACYYCQSPIFGTDGAEALFRQVYAIYALLTSTQVTTILTASGPVRGAIFDRTMMAQMKALMHSGFSIDRAQRMIIVSYALTHSPDTPFIQPACKANMHACLKWSPILQHERSYPAYLSSFLASSDYYFSQAYKF